MNRDRVKAMFAVAAFHALLGYAFITGLGFEVATAVSDNLKVFDVPQNPPPLPLEEAVPAERKSEAEEGAASPPNLRSKPTPIVAPPPIIRLEVPSPVAAAPLALPVPPGDDPSAGASNVAGPGSGSGGQGTGTGSGGRGDGSGGGGIASRAKLERGHLADSDYPRAAARAGAQGVVSVRFTVGTDGRVSDCAVTRSSANAELDAITCRLIESRFRYKPARDARGNALPEVVNKTYSWILPFRN